MISSRKATLLGMLVIMLGSSSTQACDLCNLYLSINPNDFQHSLSMNYRLRSQSAILSAGPQFRVRHAGGGYFANDTRAEERFQTLDVWANFFPARKVQLSLAVPISQHDMMYNSATEYSLSGVGDITFLGMYQVYNTTCDTVNNFRQRLALGGGVKLPTGAYKATDSNAELYNPHMQLGTGSTDVILALEYLARYRFLGINTNMSYRMSTPNQLGYAFANRLNWTAHLFALFPLWNNKFTLMPQAGFYHEQAEQDVHQDELVNDSGGSIWFGSFGSSVFWKQFSLTSTFQPVIKETLFGKQFPNDSRFIVGITWFIPSRFITR